MRWVSRPRRRVDSRICGRPAPQQRTVPAAAITAGLDAVNTIGSVDPAVVIVEARRAAQISVAPVVPIGSLARFDRPTPRLDRYDNLLEA